jgi:hypothetical protein
MKYFANIFSLFQYIQLKLKSFLKHSSVRLRSPAEKDALCGDEDFKIDNPLREQLIKFYVEGNPANLVNRDEFFYEAAKFVVLTQSCSVTSVRREFSVGSNRAKLIIDQLESASIIKQYLGYEGYKVLVKDEISLNELINSMPNIEISNCIHLLDSFYEKYKDEIEERRIEYENMQFEELKKTNTEAVKLMMLNKILKKRLPANEYRDLIKTSRMN